MKTFLASVLGILTAFLLSGFLENLGTGLFPLPYEMKADTAEEFYALFHNFPTVNLVVLVISHVLAMMAGLIVARFIDKKSLNSLIAVVAATALFTLVIDLAYPFVVAFKVIDSISLVFIGVVFILTRKKA